MATKKHGKNKRACEVYRATNRRLRNKVRKIERHLRRQPNDVGASDDLHRVKKLRDDYRVDSVKNQAAVKK